MINLYINANEVDITESVGLYLNKTFENLQNPTTYFSEYSKTITLPLTAKNKKIFDNYSREDSFVKPQRFDPRIKVPFYLLYNNKLVMRGYCKLNNANTVVDDNKLEIELYSSFALIMNELQNLTFNSHKIVSNGGTLEDKYLIDSPFSTQLNRNIVKASFEQQEHVVGSNDILDIIKFVPTWQGKYPDFDSKRAETPPPASDPANNIMELDDEVDEHMRRNFVSYYQQPAVWIDALWYLLKDKMESITDYTMLLDSSWFNNQNPYWTNLLYTCPSLFKSDEDFNEKSAELSLSQWEMNIPTMGSLSSHHRKMMNFTSNTNLCSNGIFNTTYEGYTHFGGQMRLDILVHYPVNVNQEDFCRMVESNPLFVTFSAVRQSDNKVITKRRHMYFSNRAVLTYVTTSDTYKDIGVVSSLHPGTRNFPTGHSASDGWWFSVVVDLDMDVLDDSPYYITADVCFANNGKPFEWTAGGSGPIARWTWTKVFLTSQTANGVSFFIRPVSCTVKTIDHKRSGRPLDMQHVWPSDVSPLSVILNYSKMFGLIWDVNDDDRTVTIMTRDKFFSKNRVLDWTKKVDRSHDFVLEPVCFEKRYVDFNFDESNLQRLKAYEGKWGVGYGTQRLDTEYQFDSGTDKLYEGLVTPVTARKSHYGLKGDRVYSNEMYLDDDNDGSSAGIYGSFVFFNGTQRPDARLGYKSENGSAMVLVTDDTENMVKSGEYMWNSTLTNTSICHRLPLISTIDKSGEYSVHFGRPKEYYDDVDTSKTGYVYDLFWKDFIDERYNIRNKKLTAYFYLTPDEYGDLKFSDFIKLQNTLYHPNKVVDYDFDTNSPTKVELIQVWDKEAYLDGQVSWPYLFVDPAELELTYENEKTVTVECSGSYEVDVPKWVSYKIDGGNLNLKATSNPLLGRNGIVTVSSGDLEAHVLVWQKPAEPYLNLDKVSSTVKADGETVVVHVDSLPEDVTVTNPYDWMDVITLGRAVASTSYSITGGRVIGSIADCIPNMSENTTAFISVKTNNTPNIRRGGITFSNGSVTKVFNVIQLGKKFIKEDIETEAFRVELNGLGQYNMASFKEVEVTTADNSNGTISTPQSKVNRIALEFNPVLDLVDHGDGTVESCTGGIISVTALDGRKIQKSYNYGAVVETYLVSIRASEGGHITIGGTDYLGGFVQDMTENTSLTVRAVPKNGFEFLGWSDSGSTNPRTITVTEPIDIWPIFENTKVVLYDNEDEVKFDDGTSAEFD